MDVSKTNVSFLPHVENKAIVALEHFLASKSLFFDKMLPDDQCGLQFLQAVIKIHKHRYLDALVDLEMLAFKSHYQTWLGRAVADLLLGLVTDKYALLFPHKSLDRILEGQLLVDESDESYCQGKFSCLFPRNSELAPPFTSNWPELGVVGLSTKGHVKFEKALATLLIEGKWDDWDAALAYINYVPACSHPTEAALCFLYAAMLLLKKLKKQLGSPAAPALSEIFAVKNTIMNCIQSSMSLAIRFLHPGMKFYVCRLCLGTAMQTVQLTDSLSVEYEARLITTLLHLTIHSSRFCPVWNFPSIPLSEAVLLSLKSGRHHLKYLLDLQYVEENKRPVSVVEMLYQLHENDVRGICPLEDSAGVRARTMEEMLREKGWTWSDVVKLMTSPLSPRDSDGWLIQQRELGTSMPFAKLTGFVFNISKDSPSIEIVVVPADPSNGLIGSFSMNDVQSMLQLAAIDAYPIVFSLDPPSVHQKYHPFHQWRYRPKELQNSLFIQTLFEADYLLKSFSVGAEVSAKPPFPSRPCSEGLTKNLPPDILQAIRPVSERGRSSPHAHRFWIQADLIKYNTREAGTRLEFELGEPKMSIGSHPIIPGPNGELRDTEFEDDPESPEAKFASDFTSHYNQVSRYFPIFARLRELAKLQTLVPILMDIKRKLKDKADGIGLRVPQFLLTEVQEDARQYNQEKLDNIMKRLDTDIGFWPTAENQSDIDSKVAKIVDSLPSHQKQVVNYHDIELAVKNVLQEEDQKVLNKVTALFLEISEQKLSEDVLKRSVHQWLLFRNPMSTTELRNLVCSAITLPTDEDIIQHIIQPHHQAVHSSFTQKLNSITCLATTDQVVENPCMWVPAATLTDEENTISHFGGVLLPIGLLIKRSVRSLTEIVQGLISHSVPIVTTSAESGFYACSDYTPESVPTPNFPFVPKWITESTDENTKNPESSPSESSSAAAFTNECENEVGECAKATEGNFNPDSNSNETDPNGSSSNAATNASDLESFCQAKHDSCGVDHCGRIESTDDSDSDSSHGQQREISDVDTTDMNGEHLSQSHTGSCQHEKNREKYHLSAVRDKCNVSGGDSPNAHLYSDSESEHSEYTDHAPFECSETDRGDDQSDTPIQQEVSAGQHKQDSSLSISPTPDNEVTDVTNDNTAAHDIPDLCESGIEWYPSGHGMKSLCYNESTDEKSYSPVKGAHPCPLYTKIIHNSTQKKYEELLSIQKAGRRRVIRLFEDFMNISHNSAVCENASTHKRDSALIATIDKQREWILFATKEHAGTAKAVEAVRKTNRLANANSPCGEQGCQCCNAMAQHNVCVDNQGGQVYRAELTKEVNCRSSNVVYLIRCRRSGKSIHIGQTKEELHECLNEHRTRQSSVVYQHFTSEGFSFNDMEVMILADIDDDKVREEKEDQWRKKLKKCEDKNRCKK